MALSNTSLQQLARSVQSVSSNTRSGISSLFDTLGQQSTTGSRAQSSTCFPLELRNEKAAWPYMRFGITQGPSICLPIPPGLIISDSASYSSIDLGVIQSVSNVLEEAATSGSTEGLADRTRAIVDSAKKNLVGYSALAGQIAARTTGQERIAASLALRSKKVQAPNTNTIFQNVGIRAFSFAFKLVPKSDAEAKAIKNIVDIFRHNMYPTSEASGAILNFPPSWTIQFFDGTTENTFIPSIKRSYLTNMSATYNSSTNMFHEDGSPVEIDITVQFQEMKALTRQDVEHHGVEYQDPR